MPVKAAARCRPAALEGVEAASLEEDIDEPFEVEFEFGEERLRAEKAANELMTGADIVQPGTGLAVRQPLPCVALCGLGSPEEDSAAAQLFQQLEAALGGSAEAPVWIDLATVAERSFEELDQAMARCRALVLCPPLDQTDRRKVKALRDALKVVLESVPVALSRALVLSRIGAQQGTGGFNVGSFFGVDLKSGSYASLEDELTSYARRRGRRHPLKVLVIRAGQEVETPGMVKVTLDEEPGRTSQKTAMEALFNALLYQVDAGFSVVDLPAPAAPTAWAELLVPAVGPEVWRMEVPQARQAALFVQQWASSFLRTERPGLKTPALQRKTPGGCELRFRPRNTPEAKTFEDLDEGGLEFIAEETASGSRLRARRVAYGAQTVIKANSERALLEQFERDWREAMGPTTWF